MLSFPMEPVTYDMSTIVNIFLKATVNLFRKKIHIVC